MLIGGEYFTLSYGEEDDVLSLITKAYNSNQIDKETAILLEVQAIFAPHTLPLQYKVEERRPIKCLTPLISEIRMNWKNFSEETKVKLKSLLLRPTIPAILLI
jgi:hypothetical protein